MKPRFIFITLLALFWGPCLWAQGSFAVDGGMRWQRYAYNDGQSSSQYTGPQIGIAKRLGSHFEAHLDLSLFLWATKSRFNSLESFWVSPNSPGELSPNFPLGIQSNLQVRWRPQGFQKGFYTGLGAGVFSNRYYIAYDRIQRPYLVLSPTSRPVFQVVAGYDFPIAKRHSIQLESNMDVVKFSSSSKTYLMGSFGVGWRWAR